MRCSSLPFQSPEAESKYVGLLVDHLRNEIDVLSENMESYSYHQPLKSGDNLLLSELQTSNSKLNQVKDLRGVLGMIESLSVSVSRLALSHNSEFAPKMYDALKKLLSAAKSLFMNENKENNPVMACKFITACRECFAQVEIAGPTSKDTSYVKTDSMPSGSTTFETQVEDNQEMNLNEPPPTPQEVDDLTNKMLKAKDLLDEAYSLFTHEDAKLNKQRIKNRYVRQLAEQIRKTRMLANDAVTYINKPRRKL